MRKALLLPLFLVFIFSGVCNAEIYETNFEIAAGLYVPDEEGLLSTPELTLGYSFGVHESIHAKIFVSGYVLDPDDKYKTYDEDGSDFDNIPTISVGMSVLNYYNVGVTADLYPEIGAYLTYQKVDYTKSGSGSVSDEKLGVGLLIGGGIRINQMFKASLHYRLQSSTVDDGGLSAEITLSF